MSRYKLNSGELVEVANEGNKAISDPQNYAFTDWLNGKSAVVQPINNNYLIFYSVGNNTLYKVYPKFGANPDGIKKHEFPYPIKEIKQQGRYEIFIITLDNKGKEEKVIFDMKGFRYKFSFTFSSLEYADGLKDYQRVFELHGNRRGGILNLETGTIEKAYTLKRQEIKPITLEFNHLCCIFDYKSRRVISDKFSLIGERIKNGITRSETEDIDDPNFFEEEIQVGNDVSKIIGIVTKRGQIATFVFDTLSNTFMAVPLLVKNGVDIIDREKLSSIIESSAKHSIDVDVKKQLVKINSPFLDNIRNGYSKYRIEGYDISCLKPPRRVGKGVGGSFILDALVDTDCSQLKYSINFNRQSKMYGGVLNSAYALDVPLEASLSLLDFIKIPAFVSKTGRRQTDKSNIIGEVEASCKHEKVDFVLSSFINKDGILFGNTIVKISENYFEIPSYEALIEKANLHGAIISEVLDDRVTALPYVVENDKLGQRKIKNIEFRERGKENE